MTTLTIIQARTGSQRLPGKALADVGDKTVLERVIDRATLADLGPLVVATSARAADNAIEDLCLMVGVPCYRSSEHDVLNRFYRTAVHYQAVGDDAVIVRVTADCPLLCPHLLGSVAALCQTGLDYVGVSGAPNGLGQEAFSFGALEDAWAEARSADDREHVVPFIEDDPKRFQVEYVQADEALRSRAHWRLTVDEAEDLDLLRRLYDATLGELFTLDSHAVLEAVEADAGMLALATRQA